MITGQIFAGFSHVFASHVPTARHFFNSPATGHGSEQQIRGLSLRWNWLREVLFVGIKRPGGQRGSGGCEGIRLEKKQSGLECGLNMVKLVGAENKPSNRIQLRRRDLFSTSSQAKGAQTDSKRQSRRCLVECDGGKIGKFRL